MPLPTAKTPPKRSLSDVSILLYGPSKIGKSTFASQSPDAIFLATEPGLNTLEVYQQPIRNRGEFLDICAELAKGEHPFKTVVIDTIDILYLLCADHICQKRGLEHESDGSHGKIYGLIKNEIYRVLTKLAHLPYGLILISHSQDRKQQRGHYSLPKDCVSISILAIISNAPFPGIFLIFYYLSEPP